MTDIEQQTVFIVDDDSAVRDSVRELVESVGLCAEIYASAQEFQDTFQPERSGCLVLDVRMAGMSGMTLQEKMNEMGAKIPVILVTGHGDVSMAVRALKNGAFDFIEKPCRDQALLDSINNALALDAAQRRSVADKGDFDQRLAALTKREREVLDKLFEGGTNKEIARELSISPRTVEAHRHNLLRKLQADSVKELMLRRVVLDTGN